MVFSLFAFTASAVADFIIAQWTDGVYNIRTYLLLYGCISGAVVVFHVLRLLYYALASVRASSRIHASLFGSVLGAKLSFFSKTSTSAITARFSSDMQAIDRDMAASISSVLDAFLGMITAMSVVMLVSAWYLLCMVPLTWAYYIVQGKYRYA